MSGVSHPRLVAAEALLKVHPVPVPLLLTASPASASVVTGYPPAVELVATLEVQHSIPLGNPCLPFTCSGMVSETLCSVIGLTAITAPFTDPHQFTSPLP